MTKLTFAAHPFLLGFDQLEQLVERTARNGNDGYPPYNIERQGPVQQQRFGCSCADAGVPRRPMTENDKAVGEGPEFF